MLTDLVQIRRLGEKKREENQQFRKYLKAHSWVEKNFRKAGDEIQDAIDCRQCGECCRVGEVPLQERDVEHLAKFLRIKEKAFMADYTMPGEGEEVLLKRTKEAGCVFLIGNECSVYEARPGNCERFPHILKGAGSMLSRMWEFVDRATYCPIVYNWMEAVKDLTKYKKPGTW